MPDPKEKTFTITLNLRQTLCLLSSLVDAQESPWHNGPFPEIARGLIVKLGQQIFVNWPAFAEKAVENVAKSDATAQDDTK